MWYPSNVTVAAESAPVDVDEVMLRLRIDAADDEEDVTLMIAAATGHVEKYCNTRLATQTVVMKCDRFSDFSFLPEAPVQSITSIVYVDTSGATQTLSTDVYELRADGLDAAITLKYGQSWPAVQRGSRIGVTAVVGYAAIPDPVKHAILLLIGDAYCNRENAAVPAWSATDSLLSNYRRGA